MRHGWKIPQTWTIKGSDYQVYQVKHASAVSLKWTDKTETGDYMHIAWVCQKTEF